MFVEGYRITIFFVSTETKNRLLAKTACFQISHHIGEGNGNPLQCSCWENPGDGGAWWAAVCGVAQNRTRLKRLSSSSSSIIILFENNSSKKNFFSISKKFLFVSGCLHGKILAFVLNTIFFGVCVTVLGLSCST